MKISIIMGSVSDFSKMKPACDFLEMMNIDFDIRSLSAHRSSNILDKYISDYDDHIDVYIAAAGKAAHLPGVVASKTIKPVIGVPISSTKLSSFDSLLSIVQMPDGVPVATVAIDSSLNAAILACQILSLKNQNLKNKMLDHKKSMNKKVINNENILINNDIAKNYKYYKSFKNNIGEINNG